MTTAPSFTISSADAGGVRILAVTGVFDGAAAAGLEPQVAALLARGRPRLVLDLSGVRYIASVGVGALVSCNRRCAAAGGILVLARPSEALREMFTTLNLHAILAICDDLDAAVRRAV